MKHPGLVSCPDIVLPGLLPGRGLDGTTMTHQPRQFAVKTASEENNHACHS
jgi:hypothetical protein